MSNEALRTAMSARGETADSLAEKVRVDPKTAARWVGEGRIPHARTRFAVARVLGKEVVELWPSPLRRRNVSWFHRWAELEQVAVSFRSYQPLLVPGLLQTEAYARAVLGTGGLVPQGEVERIVAGRLDRQAILAAEAPPQLVAVIDEVVLRRMVGDRAVMAGQLAHLAAMAEREHVQVRVIPAENPWHTGLAGPFVLAGLPDGTELAYLDNQLRGQIATDPVDVASLGRRWESVTGEALPSRRSVALIREVAATWS
ncbi:helix-turn-helix domain-containing protein [Micromonospora okii]|uniref:helix-turn-helix domain-containing protein n=1 Tax=Micromonospora okii TaxID=1182970 RepID=UPI001E55EEA1|nr:helix-turn-helix transcriptional regulator [Micromonospora okii]